MNASIGLVADGCAGTAGRTGFRNDHHAGPTAFTALVGHSAPLATQVSSVAISAASSFFPGGILILPACVTACVNRVPSAFEATAAARVERLTPPIAVAPWHCPQFWFRTSTARTRTSCENTGNKPISNRACKRIPTILQGLQVFHQRPPLLHA